jgi:acetyl-CoA carboxylase carboxyltransferase component
MHTALLSSRQRGRRAAHQRETARTGAIDAASPPRDTRREVAARMDLSPPKARSGATPVRSLGRTVLYRSIDIEYRSI